MGVPTSVYRPGYGVARCADERDSFFCEAGCGFLAQRKVAFKQGVEDRC